MLEETERLLKRHGASKVTVSDIATACGMSQSNAYRFFPSKQALLEALGERWFAGIEAQLATAASATDLPPLARAERHILLQYTLKRDRHAADPELFRAYVALGLGAMRVVEAHLARLRAQLVSILEAAAADGTLGGWSATEAAAVLEAATVRFRDPTQIMRYADIDTPATVRRVVGVVLGGLPVTAPEYP